MKYNNKLARWSMGNGNFLRQERPDYAVVVDRTSGENGYIRASIRRLGKKNFTVILFQGRGHKDTSYKTNRWMNVRETIGIHLCDIDRALERPLTKFRMPTEEKCFAPRIGDVVVFTNPHTTYFGELGVIREYIKETGSYHIDNGFHYPNQNMDYYSDEFEVLDHIEEPALFQFGNFTAEIVSDETDLSGAPKPVPQKDVDDICTLKKDREHPDPSSVGGYSYRVEAQPNKLDLHLRVVTIKKCLHCGHETDVWDEWPTKK